MAQNEKIPERVSSYSAILVKIQRTTLKRQHAKYKNFVKTNTKIA